MRFPERQHTIEGALMGATTLQLPTDDAREFVEPFADAGSGFELGARHQAGAGFVFFEYLRLFAGECGVVDV